MATSYSIKDIEGIGASYAKKLAAVNIKTTGALLKKAKTKAMRKQLSKDSGVTEKMILEWANRADLMRTPGVAEEYSDLLEASGVDTVKELATRNAQNLCDKMIKVNAKKSLVRSLPSIKNVEKWIKAAKKMKPGLEY